MGLFDEWATEEINHEQIEVDQEEGTVTVQYGKEQSASQTAQASVQSALLAGILARLEAQNDLMERQNELLKKLAE